MFAVQPMKLEDIWRCEKMQLMSRAVLLLTPLSSFSFLGSGSLEQVAPAFRMQKPLLLVLPAGLRFLDPDHSAVPPAQVRPACSVEIPSTLVLRVTEHIAAESGASTCQALLAAGQRIQVNGPPHPTPNTTLWRPRPVPPSSSCQLQ